MKKRKDCNYHLTKHNHCTIYKGKCSLNRWFCGEDSVGRAVSAAVLAVIIACLIASLIWVACWSSDKAYGWSYEPGFVYGPADWKKKNADCMRRAALIGGWVEYRDDDRYCVVKK